MSDSPRHPSTIPVDEAVKLSNGTASVMTLAGIRVVKAHYEIKEPGPIPEGMNPANPILHTNQAQYAKDELGGFTVRTEFRVVVPVRPPKDNPQEPFDVEVAFATQVTYTFSQPISDEALSAAVKIQGVMHSWPYWREFLQSSMSRVPILSVPAPLLSLAGAAGMAGYLKPEESSATNEPKPVPERTATGPTRRRKAKS